ncbi:MAG: hypothetical protein M1565_03810, partial [Actinobacteria bacterium]|nr:hypothetical protein [Actinomycetota bacterium]
LVIIFVSITVVAVVASVVGISGFSSPSGDELVDTSGEGTPSGTAVTSVTATASETQANATSVASNDASTAPSSEPTEARPSGTVLPEDIISERAPLIFLNPSVGVPGSAVAIAGSGFDPGATIDLGLQRSDNEKPINLGFAQTDQGGSFGGAGFTIPDDLVVGTFTVVAQQENSDKSAKATGRVRPSSPTVVFGTQVGKTGDAIAVAGKGFAPQEEVEVYFNTMKSKPIASFNTDRNGSFSRATIRVPYGPAGNNSFILVGKKSQSPVTTTFLMLNFYPTASVSTYAAKADTTLLFSGADFGPNERVFIYLNSLEAPPIAEVRADEAGAFENAGGFTIPFELRGKNTLIFVGEQSGTAVTAGFDVLPYTPYAEASTYGGRPGTSVTFYGREFARNEVVRVYVNRTKDEPGEEVSCFKTDKRGSINGGGQYTIPPGTEAGQIDFVLVGDKSRAQAIASFEVMETTGTQQEASGAAPQQKFVCPYDVEATPGPAAPEPGAGEEQQPAEIEPAATPEVVEPTVDEVETPAGEAANQ